MMTPDEEKYVLNNAYIPEHIVGLMTQVSGGDPIFFENYFGCLKRDWLILIGYPLGDDFSAQKFIKILERLRKKYHPDKISLMAPKIPESFFSESHESEKDYYFTLELNKYSLKDRLGRAVGKAREKLEADHSGNMGAAHTALMDEFVERVNPSSRVRNLLFKMPDYADQSEETRVLNAWDERGNLAAFYIVDLTAANFSAYIIGCHSKRNYVKGASDLLMYELIQLSCSANKRYIHLGLGVNDGIRRFKKKWGGVPSIKYEMCELLSKKRSILEAIRKIV